MTSLIERLEALSGPDREVDALIWALKENREVRRDGNYLLAKSRTAPYDEYVVGHYGRVGFYAEQSNKPTCPKFTGSIDAALTLVPEGVEYLVEYFNGKYSAQVEPVDGCSLGATAATALCIAALRARETNNAN